MSSEDITAEREHDGDVNEEINDPMTGSKDDTVDKDYIISGKVKTKYNNNNIEVILYAAIKRQWIEY